VVILKSLTFPFVVSLSNHYKNLIREVI